MMKKHNVFRYICLTIALLSSFMLLSACTTLSYTGSDYQAQNTQLIQTNEYFNFLTYSKTSVADKINMKLGITESPISEAMVVYVGIQNNSGKDYVFYTKDLTFSSGDKKIDVIAPSSYIDAYQNYETGNYAGLAGIAPTLGAMASIQNSYQQVTGASQAAHQQSTTQAASSQIGKIINGISSHTINNAAIINAGTSNFYYIFIRTPETYPIVIDYKDLKFTFGKAKS